jgi:hypothetical protein
MKMDPKPARAVIARMNNATAAFFIALTSNLALCDEDVIPIAKQPTEAIVPCLATLKAHGNYDVFLCPKNRASLMADEIKR